MSRTSSVVEVAIVPTPSSTTPESTSDSVLKTIKEQGRDKKCVFCNRWTVNELTLGPLYTRDGVICHYFCLLFCSNLRQNGKEDTDGILGFLTQDIRKEVKRVQGTKTSKSYNFFKCRFCNKPGATIGCFVKKCRKVYHFPCGLQNGVNFKFTSKFESYCKTHAGPKVFKPVILRDCLVCAESLDAEDCTKPIVLGRCCSNSNLHKACMQRYALSAGSHHIKCPTCADKELFIPDVKSQGIFVPEKDADWETESPNAYHELRQKYSRCDAPECLSPKGRDRNDTDNASIWWLVRCGSCASSAVHVNCENLANLDRGYSPPKWMCPICREVEKRVLERNSRDKHGASAVLLNVEVVKETPAIVGVEDDIPVNVGIQDDITVNVGVDDDIPVNVGVEDDIPVNVGVEDDITVNVGVDDGIQVNVGVDDGIQVNIGVDDDVPAIGEDVNEIPANIGVDDYCSNISDDESCISMSSDESLFTVSVVRRKISKPTGQTDEEKTNANSSSSSGATHLSVLKNESLDNNSQQELTSSPSLRIDEPTVAPVMETANVVKRKLPNLTCQSDDEESDDNISVSSGGTLFSVVKRQPSKQNKQRKMQSSPLSGINEPVVTVTIEDDKDKDEEGSQSPVLSLPGSDVAEDARSEFSAESACSSDSELSLFIPVEPPRKRKRVMNEVPVPAFKISDIKFEGSDVKEIRCYCERHTDEEPLVKCQRCSVSFHKRCRAGLYEMHGKSLQTRCCKVCTDLQALKGLLEIPLSGRYVPKGCENTRGKTYYMTLVNRAGAEEFMVRRHDALYISEKGNRDVESSRILRVEKLWKNNRGTRFISGHFYFRPSETANAETRRFYRKEIFRSSTPTTAEIKMEDVLGRCWILDLITYCKGRPSATTLDDEKHVFVCESWVDPETCRISMMELAQSIHSICMKPDAFKEFTSEMKIKKDYRVKGSSTCKPGSSSGASSAQALDNAIVVLDSDSD